MLTLLTKKLDDRTIKLESLANGLSLSSTAVQRKSDLVQWYGEKFPMKTKVKLNSPLDQNAEEENIAPFSPVNVTAPITTTINLGLRETKTS